MGRHGGYALAVACYVLALHRFLGTCLCQAVAVTRGIRTCTRISPRPHMTPWDVVPTICLFRKTWRADCAAKKHCTMGDIGDPDRWLTLWPSPLLLTAISTAAAGLAAAWLLLRARQQRRRPLQPQQHRGPPHSSERNPEAFVVPSLRSSTISETASWQASARTPDPFHAALH